jgi:Chaperone of endosialidase
MKTPTRSIHIAFIVTLLLGYPAFLPMTRAVLPPPDGGYPGGNTAEGQNALFSQTTGGFNTAVGWLSLKALTTGSFNTAAGAGTLALNSGDENTATGAGALLSNTIGADNTANGAFALFSNTTGVHNTAIGLQALLQNTTGNDNTANGVNALLNNTTGSENTAIGFQALLTNTDGGGNVAAGLSALLNNTTGFQNTAIGLQALSNNTTGHQNTAIGINAGNDVTTANNVICIGDSVVGENVNNSCYIGHIFGQPSPGGTGVFINLAGKLGTTTSSRRFKDDIRPMDKASEAILALRPVSFRYKKEIDPQGIPQFGLVAEEVEKVNPDLIIRDSEGKPHTVRYEQINAMLLNEFLKEHKKVEEQGGRLESQALRIQEQETTIAQLRSDIEAVVTHSKEQDAQIQRVSAQLDRNGPVLQTVVENR